MTCRAWRSRCGSRKGANARAPGRSCRPSATDPGLSGRLAARRQGAARMGRAAQGRRMARAGKERADRRCCCGTSHAASGLAVAVATAAMDQASKLWLLYGFDLRPAARCGSRPSSTWSWSGTRASAMACSSRQGVLGQWALLAIKAVAIVLLWFWLARTGSRLTAVALGLITGGAVGNAIDRLRARGGRRFRPVPHHHADHPLQLVRLQLRGHRHCCRGGGALYESLFARRCRKSAPIRVIVGTALDRGRRPGAASRGNHRDNHRLSHDGIPMKRDLLAADAIRTRQARDSARGWPPLRARSG